MLSFAFKKLKHIQNHIQCPITFKHYLNNKSDMWKIHVIWYLNCVVYTIYIKGDVVMGAMYLIENCSDHKSSTITLLNCIPQCNHPRPWKNVGICSIIIGVWRLTALSQQYFSYIVARSVVLVEFPKDPDETTDLS